MYINKEGKYTSEAEYYYNSYIEMYCVVDTTICGDLCDILDAWENQDLLTEIPMPEYVTGDDYDGEW